MDMFIAFVKGDVSVILLCPSVIFLDSNGEELILIVMGMLVWCQSRVLILKGFAILP